MNQPPILEVVEREGVELRQRGSVWWGLCPFHADQNPSFKVDSEKGRWHCFACNEDDDAIGFIRKLHRVGYKEALKILSIAGESIAPPPDPQRELKKQIDAWAKKASQRICTHLREVVGQELHVCTEAKKEPGADMALIAEHEESLEQQWEILTDMDDDLNKAEIVGELWEHRAMIDAFIENLSIEARHRQLDRECDEARDRDTNGEIDKT